jgi:hypothetical protein
MLKLGTATFTVVAKAVDGSRRQSSRKQQQTIFVIYFLFNLLTREPNEPVAIHQQR